jgi:alanyl-tRNA synthetase
MSPIAPFTDRARGLNPDSAWITARVKAGSLVKALAPIVGGGGGGRPDFAEAGGKDPSKIDELLARAPAIVREQLGSST